MASKTHSVKKLGASFIGAIAVCMFAITPVAFAGEAPLVSQTVSVKFRMTDLKAEDGTQKVYAKFSKKATSFCRADTPSLYYLGESISDCRDDLVKQFVQSANIEELTTYHLSQTSFASLKTLALK